MIYKIYNYYFKKIKFNNLFTTHNYIYFDPPININTYKGDII